MFEDSTFDSTGLRGGQVGRWWVVALGLNLAVVAGAVVVPMIWPQALPAYWTVRELTVPAPGRAVEVQRQVGQTAAVSAKTMVYQQAILAMPKTPPKGIDTAGAPPVDGVGLDLGGTGSVGTGIPGGWSPVIVERQPVVVAAKPGRFKVSGGVTEGLLLTKVAPSYPVIAKTAGVAGVVVLSANISKDGRIEELHVVSGNQMLTGAAIAAVQQWRYRPFLLNGEPVAVETTVRVVFSLGRE
jgi:protein TonB